MTVMHIHHISDYSKRRADEYPPLSEFADAIYWQTKGDNSKMEEYLRKCEEVKAKYPKILKPVNQGE